MKSDQRILVVDDDDAIRALLQTVLRRRGFRVDGARNGMEALEQLAAGGHALVILDLMMPRMSGYGVLDHLARQSPLARPRVLVLTAGMEARVDTPDLVVGTVHKPFDIELLVDIVTGFLSAAQQEEEGEQTQPAETVELSNPN